MATSAKFYISVNGGANQDGGIEVPSAAVLSFIPASTVGWLRQRWEIYDYPEGWATPSGWSVAADGRIYSDDVNPDDVTLPASTVMWGKWMTRLLVNEQIDDDQNVLDGLLDESTAVSMLSPLGMRDSGARETAQFTTAATRAKQWARDHQRNLRALEAMAVDIPLAPADIEPSGTNGQVLTTVDGATVWAAPGGGGGGGSSAGGAGQVQTSDGAGGFTAPTDVLAGAGFVSIGASPAASGSLRFGGAGAVNQIVWNNGTSDFAIVKTEAGGNGLEFGSTSHAGNYYGSAVTIYAAAGATFIYGAGAERLRVEGSGVSLGGGGGDYGGGDKVIFIANAATVPTADPTGGGILYCEGGALKFRGSAGTITTIAPA